MTQSLGRACKEFSGDTEFECCSQLLQMWGGSGIMNSTGMNRYLRAARAKMVAEGSTELHHAVIARVLGIAEVPAPVSAN